MRRAPFHLALPLTALFLLGGVVALSRGEPPAKTDKQLADLEKRLADLRQQLEQLKSGKKPAATAQAKKPLTLAEAATWRSIRGAELSPDGKWFAARIVPAEGNGEVVLRSIAEGKETKFPAGGGFGQAQFSADSKWLAFSVRPYTKPGSPPTTGPRPKPKVVLVSLATGAKTEFEGASSFQFNGESATHLAMRKANESPVVPAGPPRRGAPTPPAVTPTSSTGGDLVLRDLVAGIDLVFGNVAEFAFDKKGHWLVMAIDAAGQIGNGIQLRDMKTGAVYPIESAKASYRRLSWDEEASAFAVLKGIEDKDYDGKRYTLLGFTDLGPKPTRYAYDPKDDKEFPKDMQISPNRSPDWTDDRGAILFGIAERKKKEGPKKASTPVKKDEEGSETAQRRPRPRASATPSSSSSKPDLVIWHWRDERLQPMQEKQAGMDRLFTYTCAYRVKEKKFLRLADKAVKRVTPAAKQRYAIGTDTRPYEYMSHLDGRRYADIYVIDLQTGARKKALTKNRYYFGTSPTGTQLLYYDDGQFFVYDMATSKSVNITAGITATTFVDTEDDHNIAKPPTSPVGWSRDGKYVLLSDDWDIWQVSTDGSGGVNLTQNGKHDGIRYRGLMQYEADRKPGLDLTKPIYTTFLGEWTKKSGIGRIDSDKSGVHVLLWGDCQYGAPIKAKHADVFAFTRQTYLEYPDYYLTDADFQAPKKVTTADPQQADYLWSAGTRLIEYKALGGKRLQGALLLPANYQPGKKYPTIVYIYEKLSDGLHRYSLPGTWGITSIYTSNGYAVLMPDIAYKVNDPGRSSVACILAALDAAVATGIVDNDKVALHGHSWGGYQTAFAVTQTNRFKCAIAGAALTDLVSMYSSVYWNTGSANQPIFESSQGRFTAGYWDQQAAYIRNSPVFFAKNVHTPLLMLHNDKDGAVDFTQGIEYYNTLRRLQRPVVMLQYKGENHGLSKPENRKDYATRMREFFDHYLMGKPAPIWWKDGVPLLQMDEYLKGKKP